MVDELQISIVMPIYNGENFLRQALDTLLAQTFSAFELICVNDGSTDASLSILREYAQKDNRIKIIDKKNTGAGDSRNIGIKQARGKYLLVLDADDFFEKNMLELAFNRAEESVADMVVYRYYYFDQRTQKAKEQNYSFPGIVSLKKDVFSKTYIPQRIFNVFSNAPFFKLYRRDFILKNGIEFDNLRCCNDMTFSLLSIYKAEKIALLNTPLVYYRINTSTQISANRGKYSDCIFEALNSFLSQCPIDKKYLDSFYLCAISSFSYEYKNSINKEDFLTKVRKFLPHKYWKKFLYKIGKVPFYKKFFSYSTDAANIYVYLLGIKLKLKLW